MTSDPTSILIFRNGSIGNTLVAVPALRALHTSFPQARLSVVVDPLGRELLLHCPWIDELIVYDKRGRDRGLGAHARLVAHLRSLHPTHAILFKRFFRNGLLAFLSGAPIRAGFVTNGSAPFLNLTIPYNERIHHVDMNLALVERLGAVPAGRQLEMFLDSADLEDARKLSSAHFPESQPFLCAHYGGSTWFSAKCIPVPRFVELLRLLAGDRPLLLLGSGNAETAWANEIASQLPSAIPACNLPVRTSAALAKRAELFIGFNSGPSHIAAAVGTPLLMLFESNERTAAQIIRWLPLTNTAVPLMPPYDLSDGAWREFYTLAEAAAKHVQQLPRPGL
jgi:heptosyltransferase II